MDKNALERQKQLAHLASDYVRDHPNLNIRTVDDFYTHVKNSPTVVDTWIKNRNDIPLAERTLSVLASSFQAAERLDDMAKHSQDQPSSRSDKEIRFEQAAMLLAPLAYEGSHEVKLAKIALTSPSPEISTYQFIPTGIAQNEEYKAELNSLNQEKIQELKDKNPGKTFTKDEINDYLRKQGNLELEALNRYANTSERAEGVRESRELDVYIKDASGRIIGEKVFKDNSGRAQPNADPVFATYQRQKREAINAAWRKNADDKKNGIKPKYNDAEIKRILDYQYDGHFAALFPEKAAAYSKVDHRLAASLKILRKAESKLQKEERKKGKATSPPASPTQRASQPSQSQQPTTSHVEPDLSSIQSRVAKGYLKYFTPFGLASLGVKKILPENVKARLRKKTQQAPLEQNTSEQKPREETSPTPTPPQTNQPSQSASPRTPRTRKTVRELQKKWNDTKIGQAIQRGYNRSALVQRVRNMKIWKSRAWKAVSPRPMGIGGVGLKKAYNWNKKRTQADEQQNQNQGSTPSRGSGQIGPRKVMKMMQGGEKLSEWTTPQGLGKKAWNKFASPRVNNLNTRLGQRFGNASPRAAAKTARKGVQKAGQKAAQRAASELGKKILTQAALAFFKTPPGWITLAAIGIVLIIFSSVMVIILFASGEGNNGLGSGTTPPGGVPTANPIPGLTLSLTGPTQISNPTEVPGVTAEYTVSVSYDQTRLPGPIENVTIYLDTPTAASFSESSGVETYNTTTRRVSWSLSEAVNRNSFTFTLGPTTDNSLLRVFVYATLTSTTGGPVTQDNCNGFYSLTNPIGNFGDPDCFFANNNAEAKSQLFELLKSLDPVNAEEWYLKVVPCESGYNPNAHADHVVVGTPDAAGAWGLYQMGRGLNGEFDHGDVPWQVQTGNAVSYGKILTNNGLSLGAYWACWR